MIYKTSWEAEHSTLLYSVIIKSPKVAALQQPVFCLYAFHVITFCYYYYYFAVIQMLSFRVILCCVETPIQIFGNISIFLQITNPSSCPNSLDESTERQLEALMLTAKWGKLLIWLIALVTQDNGMPHTSFMLYYVKYFDKNVKKCCLAFELAQRQQHPMLLSPVVDE